VSSDVAGSEKTNPISAWLGTEERSDFAPGLSGKSNRVTCRQRDHPPLLTHIKHALREHPPQGGLAHRQDEEQGPPLYLSDAWWHGPEHQGHHHVGVAINFVTCDDERMLYDIQRSFTT
jgi:hypothetical protein